MWSGEETKGEFRADRALSSLDWTNIGYDASDGDNILAGILACILKTGLCRLRELRISVRQMDPDGAIQLAEGLFAARNQLETLYITALFPLPHFKENIFELFDWSSKEISSMDVIILSRFLDENTSIKKLKLNSNDIKAPGVMRLMKTVEKMNKLQTLELGSNNFGDPPLIFIGQMLEINNKLIELDIRGNNISDDGVSKLCEGGAPKNKKLKRLNLSYNSIGDIGLVTLKEEFSTNTTLEELHLSNNNISDVMKKLTEEENLTRFKM